MKGIIKDFHKPSGCAWIIGEDGRIYFSHQSECVNAQNLQKGNIVMFDVKEQPDRQHPRAVSVVKTGFGDVHPFRVDIRRAIELILDKVPDSQEKRWRLRDLYRIEKYFSVVEDFELCRNPQERFGEPKEESIHDC